MRHVPQRRDRFCVLRITARGIEITLSRAAPTPPWNWNAPAGSLAALDQNRQMSASDSVNENCTLRIELCDSKPLIWRDVEVPTSVTLKVLHDIIQATMGWFDYHLWEFTVGRQKFGVPMDEDWGAEPRIEAGKVRLREVLTPRKTTINYLYDLGDAWEHRLIFTNVRQGAQGVGYRVTSLVNVTHRRRTAAASRASTRNSTPRPIPVIRTTSR